MGVIRLASHAKSYRGSSGSCPNSKVHQRGLSHAQPSAGSQDFRQTGAPSSRHASDGNELLTRLENGAARKPLTVKKGKRIFPTGAARRMEEVALSSQRASKRNKGSEYTWTGKGSYGSACQWTGKSLIVPQHSLFSSADGVGFCLVGPPSRLGKETHGTLSSTSSTTTKWVAGFARCACVLRCSEPRRFGFFVHPIAPLGRQWAVFEAGAPQAELSAGSTETDSRPHNCWALLQVAHARDSEECDV